MLDRMLEWAVEAAATAVAACACKAPVVLIHLIHTIEIFAEVHPDDRFCLFLVPHSSTMSLVSFPRSQTYAYLPPSIQQPQLRKCFFNAKTFK